MNQYIVKKLKTYEEMDPVVDLIYEAQYRPYMPSAQILFPIFGYTATDWSRSIEQTKLRLWRAHTNNDLSTQWICVKDRQTNIVVAATQWAWYDGSPFSDGKPKLNLNWWPDCPANDFGEEIVRQTMIQRCLWMRYRHGGLGHMIVHPDYLGKGIGRLMMKWSNRRLDAKDIEGFLEASELGRVLYEKWGYQAVMKLDFVLPLNMPSEWYRLSHELKMPAWYAMWRPAREEKRRGRPWQ